MAERRFIDADTAAQLLGFRNGASTTGAAWWRRTHGCPYYRLGGRIRFDAAELEQWARGRRVGEPERIAENDHAPAG